ncbi:MAG: radical SAM protein [Minicystis sp.]
MSRVLLVAPRVGAEPSYPLLVAHAAPLLERAGHEVEAADLAFETRDELARRLAGGRFDWLGCVATLGGGAEVRRVFAAAAAPVRTFVIGPLPALDRRRALHMTGAELAVAPFEALPDALAWARAAEGDPPPGCAVSRGGILAEGPAPRGSRLADLPRPSVRLFDVGRYSHAVRAARKPYAAIVTSRGCARGCAYCPVPALFPGGFDARPADQVYAEMADLARAHGVRNVLVEDDQFLHDRARVVSLCDALGRDPLPLTWELVNGVRPDLADAHLLARMGRAGCRRIVFSFEHVGRPAHGVGYDYEVARAAVVAARRAGIGVGGYFIVGLPGVDARETQRGLVNAFRLRLDQAKFSPFVAVPGSPFAERTRPLGLPPAHAKRLCQAAELAFFAQPRVALSLLRDLASDPAALPTFARRALELGRVGGPYPFRTAL